MDNSAYPRSCEICGSDLPVKASFCPVCGIAVNAPNLEPVIAVVDNPYTHCSRCGASLIPEATFCASCGLAVENMNPQGTSPMKTETDEQGIDDEDPASDEVESIERTYPALGVISTVFRVLGVLIIFFSIVGSVVWLAMTRVELTTILIVLGSIILGVMIGCIFFALAESIRLMVDIEQNQRFQLETLEEILDSLPEDRRN